MAFGIPGSESSSGGEFLKGRLQYDARVGFWKTVDRVQESDGAWTNQEGQPQAEVTFLADFGSLEVGYSKISSPPVFLMVPYGQLIPPQPTEMGDDGKKKAFQPAFRVKIMAPKLFGDGEPRHFGSNSKTVMGPFEALYQTFTAAPEAHAGKIPIVAVKGSTAIEVKTPQGKSKFYAPNFTIAGWADRPAEFGDRTVPAPKAAVNGHAHTTPHQVPANHVPPPAPKPAPAAALVDNEMPF